MSENSTPFSCIYSCGSCACRISWLVTRVFYLCLEPSVFRLLNKYFGFRAGPKKNIDVNIFDDVLQNAKQVEVLLVRVINHCIAPPGLRFLPQKYKHKSPVGQN